MRHEYSCGAIVFTREGGGARYVIVRSLKGVSGFPKGHMEPGETEEQTAQREAAMRAIWDQVGKG